MRAESFKAAAAAFNDDAFQAELDRILEESMESSLPPGLPVGTTEFAAIGFSTRPDSPGRSDAEQSWAATARGSAPESPEDAVDMDQDAVLGVVQSPPILSERSTQPFDVSAQAAAGPALPTPKKRGGQDL